MGDMNVNNISLRSWRATCGSVMQDGKLFNDTIQNNVVLDDENINYESLQKPVEAANINHEIEAMPQGYQTMTGEMGRGLSGGQRQRLLIARALYKDPDYLFLGEATNALDTINEQKIVTALNNVFKNRTVIVIAHRLSTIRKADQIMLKTAQQRCDVSQKWIKRYISLNKSEVATDEYEVDQVKKNHLAIIQEMQSIKRDIAITRMQITEAYNKISQLGIEQKEKERNLKLDILASLQDLKGNIAAWEQRYVFKAPLDGKLEYLKFRSDGQFIQAGEEIFGVVPKENQIYGQVLLPANGAGKVKKGSRVAIKLDNYPYMEYGYIEGFVSSVSLISQPQKTEKSTIETYLINVELPNGLKTNYGETLGFKYEIGGSADIIVKERRHIHRLQSGQPSK